MASGGAEEDDGGIPLDIDNVHMLLQVEQEQIQKRTFTNWINAQLSKRCPPSFVSDLFSDLRDGSQLLNLLEVMSGQPMKRQKGRGVFQQRANIETALDFLKRKSIKLVNINISDIIDGRPSIILGLIWTIVLHCHIEELASTLSFSSCHSSLDSLASLDSWSGSPVPASPVPAGRTSPLHKRFRMSAKKVLLMWVRDQLQRVGCCVSVKDFKSSWRSGEAFLAILCALRPELVDMSLVQSRSNQENLEEAFRLAEKELHIARLLEPQDVDVKDPEEKSIMTYVAQFLQYSKDMPAPDDHLQVSSSKRAREVTCWLEQAFQELSEAWTATENSSFAEKYHVFQNLNASFTEQRRPVMTLFASIKRCPELSQEQCDLRTAWDRLEEELQKCKAELDSSLPPPLDSVVEWIQRAEAVLTEEGGTAKDHAEAAKEARAQQDKLKTLICAMSRHVNTLDNYQNTDDEGNVLVPPQRFDEIKRRLTSMRVTAKYQGIKLEYQASHHTVLNLLGRLSAKVQIWKAPFKSQETVHQLLQDWHETVERQGLPLILMDALQKLKEKANAYTSKAALGEDSQSVPRQVKEADSEAEVLTQAVAAVRVAMERTVSVWETYDKCFTSLQTWLLQRIQAHAQCPATVEAQDMNEWTSCHALLNEAGNLLIEVTETATSRAMAEQISKVNMQWAECRKRTMFEVSSQPSVGPPCLQTVHSLTQEASWLLRQPLDVSSVQLKANRQKLQLLSKKMADVDLSSLSPTSDFTRSDIENFKQTLPQRLAEAERACGELQRAASKLEGRLAELDHWSTEALDCHQNLRVGKQKGRSALEPTAKVLISRGLQLENQVVIEGQDLRELVTRVQKSSPLQNLSTSVMQDRISEAVSHCQEILGMFSFLGYRQHFETACQPHRHAEAGSVVVARTKHVEQIGNVTLQTQDPNHDSAEIPSPTPQPRSRGGLRGQPKNQRVNTHNQPAIVIPHVQMLIQPVREPVTHIQSPLAQTVFQAESSPRIHPRPISQAHTQASSQNVPILPAMTHAPVESKCPKSAVVSQHTVIPGPEEKESSAPSQTEIITKSRIRVQPATLLAAKTSPKPPMRSEVHLKAQSMARSRLEKARVCLQGRIQHSIQLFSGKEISEPQAKRKKRALKILQPAFLEEFLGAVDGFGAFCTGPQLQDLMLLSDSVRKQWEDVRREMAAFVPLLLSKIREGNQQSFSVVKSETQTNAPHETTDQNDHEPLLQTQVAVEGSAEERAESLREMCDTLTPSQPFHLATDQLMESDGAQEPSDTVLPSDWGGPPRVNPPPGATGMSTHTLQSHRLPCKQSVEELQPDRSPVWSTVSLQPPGDVTTRKQHTGGGTGTHLKPILRAKEQQLTARLLHIPDSSQKTQTQTHIQAVVRGNTVETKQEAQWTLIPETAVLPQEEKLAQQEVLARFGMTSVENTTDLMECADDPTALITEKLDQIIRESVDISTFTSVDPRLLSDLKEMEDGLQSEMRKLSEQGADVKTQGPEAAASSPQLHSRVHHLQQLRLWLDRVQSAAQALDHFLGTVGEVKAETPSTLPENQDPGTQHNEAQWEKERQAWRLAMQQKFQAAAELSDSIDSTLKAVGITMSLSQQAVDVERELQRALKREIHVPIVKEQIPESEKLSPLEIHQNNTIDDSAKKGRAQEQGPSQRSTEEESGVVEAKKSRLEGGSDKAQTWKSEAIKARDQRGGLTMTKGEEKAGLVRRRVALLTKLREIKRAAEKLELQEPTLPALHHRNRALTELESRLAGHLTDLQYIQDVTSQSGITDGTQNRELRDVWEETTKAVTERLEQCNVLTELLKRFQSVRGGLSGTLQRAESTISEQASYMGKDNLQRLHTKVQETKAELSGLGDGIDEFRSVCRQLHVYLRQYPQCTAIPYENEADALMDRWLDISERTDSHLENLHLSLTRWEGVLQLGLEVDSWTADKLAVFAQSLSFETEEDICALQNEIFTQEENMERFKRRASEIQALLQSSEPPLELQVVETQMRKKIEQLRELVSEAEDVYTQTVAAKGQIAARMAECFDSLQKIQDSLRTLAGSDVTTVLAKLKDVLLSLQTQEEQAESVLEDLRVVASIASPLSLHSLSEDGLQVQETVRHTHQLYSQVEEQTERNIQALDRLQRESEHLELWLHTVEEKAAKEEDVSLLKEEARQQRVKTEALNQLVSSLQGSTLQQCDVVEKSKKLLERYHDFHTNVMHKYKESTQSMVGDLTQIDGSPLGAESSVQSLSEQELHPTKAVSNASVEGQATIKKTQEEAAVQPHNSDGLADKELMSSYRAQREEACSRVEELQRRTAQLPSVFPWPGTAERRQTGLLVRQLQDETESLQLTVTSLDQQRRELDQRTSNWKGSSLDELKTCCSSLTAELKGVCSRLEEGVCNEEHLGQLLRDCQHKLTSVEERMSACQDHKQSSADLPALEALQQEMPEIEKDLLQIVTLKDSIVASSTANAQASLLKEFTDLQNHKGALDNSIRDNLALITENANPRNQHVKEEVTCVQSALKDLAEKFGSLPGIRDDVIQLKQQWYTIQDLDTSLTELTARVNGLQTVTQETLPADVMLTVDEVAKDLDSLRSMSVQKKQECADNTADRVSQATSTLQKWSQTVQTEPSSPSQAAVDEGLQLQQALQEVLSERDFLLSCLGKNSTKKLKKRASNALSESTSALETLSKCMVSQVSEGQSPLPCAEMPDVIESDTQQEPQQLPSTPPKINLKTHFDTGTLNADDNPFSSKHGTLFGNNTELVMSNSLSTLNKSSIAPQGNPEPLQEDITSTQESKLTSTSENVSQLLAGQSETCKAVTDAQDLDNKRPDISVTPKKEFSIVLDTKKKTEKVGPDVQKCSQTATQCDAKPADVSSQGLTKKKSELFTTLISPQRNKTDLKKSLHQAAQSETLKALIEAQGNENYCEGVGMKQDKVYTIVLDVELPDFRAELSDAKPTDISSLTEKKSSVNTTLVGPESDKTALLNDAPNKSRAADTLPVNTVELTGTKSDKGKSTGANVSCKDNSGTHELIHNEVLNSAKSQGTVAQRQLTGVSAEETTFTDVEQQKTVDLCQASASDRPESQIVKVPERQDKNTLSIDEGDLKEPASLEITEDTQRQPQIQQSMETERTALAFPASPQAGETAGGTPESCTHRSTMQDVLSGIQSLVERSNIINRTPHIDLNWYLKSSPSESEILLERTVQRILACRYKPAQLDVNAMAKQLQEAEDYRRCVQEQVATLKSTSTARICDPDALKSVEAEWSAALLDASATVQVKAAQLDQVKQYHKRMKVIRAFLEVLTTEKDKMSLNTLGSSALQASKLRALLQTTVKKKDMMEELLQLSSQLSEHLSDAESSGALLAQIGDVQEEWRLLEGSFKRALQHSSSSTTQSAFLIKEAEQLKAKLEALQNCNFQSHDSKSALEFVSLTTDLKLYNQLYQHLQSESDALVHLSLGQKEKDKIKRHLQELRSFLNVTKNKLDTSTYSSGISSSKISRHLQELIIWAKQAENHISIGKKLALFPEEARIQIVEMKKSQTDVWSKRSRMQAEVEQMKSVATDMNKEDGETFKTVDELYEAIGDSLDHVLDTMKKNLKEREKLLFQLANMDAWLAETQAKRDPCGHVDNVSNADLGELESELRTHKLATTEIENQLKLVEAMTEHCRELEEGLSPGEGRYLVNRISGLWTELDGLLALEKATSWDLEELIHERTSSDEELSTIQSSLQQISADLLQQSFPLRKESLSTFAHWKRLLMEHQFQVQELQHCQEAKRSSVLCTIGELQDQCKTLSTNALEHEKYLHLREQMEESRDIAKEQIQRAKDETISVGERFGLCQTLLVEIPLVKTQCQEAADQLEAIAQELNPSELDSERQRIRNTVKTLVSQEDSVADDIKQLEAKLLLSMHMSSELPASIELFQRITLELEGAEPVNPDEKAIDIALRRYWVIWRNMESVIRVLEGLATKEKINLENNKELLSLLDATIQECHLRMESLSKARESLKDYQWAAQGAIGFLHNAEATFLSAPGGFLDCTEEQRQTRQALEALENGFQAHILHLVELVPQQPCLSRPKTEQLHISILSQLLVGRAILEAQAQLRLETLQRCVLSKESHRTCHEDIRQRLSGSEAKLSECAAKQVTSYGKCVVQLKRAKLLMEDLRSLAGKIEELRAACPMQGCGVGKDGELGALWRRWVSLRRGVGLLLAHTEQRAEEWKDITKSMEQCCSFLASLQADVPDSSIVSFTQEEPQELLAQAEINQVGLEKEQQALASLEHRLEHALSLSSSQEPISPGPVGKTLVKIQENVRSLKERNLLVVTAAQAEEKERQQVQEEIGQVEQHLAAIHPSLETCSSPNKQQELEKDLSSQKAKLKYIGESVQSRYAEIPADISRRLQEVQLSLQQEEKKLMEVNNPVRKLDSQVVALGSGLEKVKVLLEQKSPTVIEAQKSIKRVWDELDVWHSRLMLLENEVQDLAEEHPDHAHLLMDQLSTPLQLYQNTAQMAEQRTAFLSKIPACLHEFDGIVYSATCWLAEAQTWLTASSSFTTARSLQSHANSLQLVLDDSQRIRHSLQDFRQVLDEISSVCDVTTQREKLDHNDKQLLKTQHKIIEQLDKLLQAAEVVESVEGELTTMEKNVPKIRAILSIMENSNITLTEHLNNRQVILANLQSMRRTLEEMEGCKGELKLPQGAEDSLLVFSRAKLLLQPLEELEQLSQQQATVLENKIKEDDKSGKALGATTVSDSPEEIQQSDGSPHTHLAQQEAYEASHSEEEDENESCHSSSSDTLTCSIPEDPEETPNTSDVQSDEGIAVNEPLADLKAMESSDGQFTSEVETNTEASQSELLSVKPGLEGSESENVETGLTKMDPKAEDGEAFGPKTVSAEPQMALSTTPHQRMFVFNIKDTVNLLEEQSEVPTIQSSSAEESQQTQVSPEVPTSLAGQEEEDKLNAAITNTELDQDRSLKPESGFPDLHTKSLQTAAAVEDTRLVPVRPIAPFTATTASYEIIEEEDEDLALSTEPYQHMALESSDGQFSSEVETKTEAVKSELLHVNPRLEGSESQNVDTGLTTVDPEAVTAETQTTAAEDQFDADAKLDPQRSPKPESRVSDLHTKSLQTAAAVEDTRLVPVRPIAPFTATTASYEIIEEEDEDLALSIDPHQDMDARNVLKEQSEVTTTQGNSVEESHQTQESPDMTIGLAGHEENDVEQPSWNRLYAQISQKLTILEKVKEDNQTPNSSEDGGSHEKDKEMQLISTRSASAVLQLTHESITTLRKMVSSADGSHPVVNEELYKAVRRLLLCMDTLTDFVSTPGGTGEHEPHVRLLQQECVSAELVTLAELLSEVESMNKLALSKEEPEALHCLASLQSCVHTVQLVFTSYHSQLGIPHHHQELSSDPMCLLDEFDLGQSEMFPSIKHAPSLERCVMGRHLRESPGENAKLQQAARALLQGITRVLELGEECIPEGQKSQVHNRSQLQALLCSHKNLLQVLRSQLAFVQHLFQREPGAMRCQEDEMLRLEVRAKALLQLSLEQDAASQRRIQEWARWEDSCGGLGRVLDDVEASVSVEPEGDDEKLIKNRHDGCQQTLVQLDESRAALGLILDQRKVLQTDPVLAATVTHTGGGLQLRWQRAYRRTEQEIQRCRDIQDSGARLQAGFASVTNHLVGSSIHLKTWSDLVHTPDLDQECIQNNLIKLLDFSMEIGAMSVQRASVSGEATKLLHLKEADCPGLRAQLAQLEVDWSQQTSDLSKIQEQLQQQLLASWPPVKLLSDLDVWLEKKEARLNKEKETILKFKDAAQVTEILQNFQHNVLSPEIKAGMANGQLLLDFLCQSGPQLFGVEVHALSSEHTMFAEKLGDLRWKWQEVQTELESQIHAAEQTHHTCADRERRLQHLHGWIEQQRKLLNEWKQPTCQTIARKALVELESAQSKVQDVSVALQKLKSTRVHVEGEEDHPSDISMAGKTESVCHACGDLGQQMEALRPALKQTVEEWSSFERDVREVSLLATRARCALLHQPPPLFSLKQAQGYMDILQQLQEDTRKGEELWASLDQSHQCLVKTIHCKAAKYLDNQVEEERKRWHDMLQELKDEHKKTEETLSLWQSYTQLSDQCSLRLQTLWHQWEDTQGSIHSMEQLHDAVEELQSSVGDVLAASKPLIGRLQPPVMDLIQSETRLLSRDVLLLSQAVSGKKTSLQEDLEHQKLFHTHLEAIEKQTENIQHKLKNSLNDKNSVKGVLLELSDVFVSLVDVRELSGCVTLNDHQTERLHSLSTQWLQSMTHTSDTDRELQAEYQRCQNFEQMCGNMTSIQKKLEEELMSKKLQSYSSPQEMLAVYQRLQAETRVGQQLLQGLLHHAVESMEKETGEERSALMAKVTCMRESWLKTMALAGQWKSLTKEQVGHWRVYNLGLKRLWKLLRDVDPLLPPAGPALCALHQLPSCADDYKCVEDTLGLHSGVYSETLQAGRHLCENMEDSECRSRLQSELQAIEEAWVRSSSLLERRRELVNTTLQKWSQCQDLITTSMRQLDELKTVLKQLHDSEDEKHIQGTELSLQRLASGLRDLSTMKTDLSQYVAAGDSALLEQQLEQLHAQWEELRMKVSLRRQEIADRLNAWTIFNDKNKEFCDWLTQMENKVCHSGDLSIEEMVEKLKKDCMEEINLFSENKSHLKQLGEQLLLASDQAKQSQVHGSLQEVNLRWHNLFHHIEARVKKLKETLVTVQQLDKNMSNLRSWLSRIEADLSRPITYSVCHQQEIQKRLAEQQELQRDIEQHTEGVASVLSLCDVLLRDEDAAGGTETDSDSLQETSRSLDQRWRTICALALDRRLRIEETSRLWSKFLDDYSRFEDWLKMAERTAANPNSADVLYTVAKEELKKFEGFQRQVHERLTQLELVNNQYRRLARENRTDRASHLKVMVHQGNRRWDVLHRRVAAVLRRLKYFTSQREEFEGTRESMLVWLTELDLQLTNVEHFSESDVHHKIQQLNSFQQDITLNTERIDGLIVFGENLIQRSSPQDAELIEDELEELHSYCQEVFSRLVRFHQRLSQPPMIREEEEFSTATFSMESSLELIGRPWLGRSQCSLPATPSHLLACPLERSGRETPVSVADSLPLEWDHTGDVGGSTSHEDDDEEEDEEDEEGRTYFSALSEVELTEIQEEFVEASEVIRASSLVSSRSIAAHESPRWRSQDDTETQPLHLDSEDHPEATPTLTSTPLKQGYLRLMTQCSGSIQDIKRVSLILDDDEQPEELGLTGIISSDKQSGVIERWELLEARSRSDQHTGPQDLQQLTSHLDDITSWLEKVMPELERLQHSDPAASVEDMAARAKELKEMQKMFTRYKSTMLSVNLRAQEAPELQERLAGMNRDWSRASTGLQQWDTGLRKTLMRCQEFHKTLHSLLLWLAHAESRRYAVDISHPDTPVKALQQHHSTLTDLQSELQGRQTQQASLQALWSQLQPEEEAEESTEAQEKLHVTGSKLKLLLCQVDQDLNNLQQRLGCESATNVQGATADPSMEATNSKKGSSSKRRKRDSSPPPSFFYRVLRAAFPLHLLLLFLLLLPCLIPLSESVPGCTGTNNFARSFYPMLRYTNGPPPT